MQFLIMVSILSIYAKSFKYRGIYLCKTIFDYNVAQEELHKLNVSINREDYATKMCKMSKLYHIYMLMSLRGDAEQAKKMLHEMCNYFTK